ncbi:MAG: hypothetical protein ACTII7_09745 [Galactobacter sp.]
MTAPRKKSRALTAVLILAALIGLITWLTLRSDTEPAPQKNGTEHAMQAGPTISTAEGQPSDDQAEAASSGSAVDTAEAFVAAYSSISSDDPEPTTWVTRAITHTTTDYADELTKSFSGGGGEQWRQMQENHQYRQATDITITAFPNDPDTYMAEYTQETVEDDQVIASSDQIKILTLTNTDAGWKVAEMTQLGDQPNRGPVAPSDMGEDIEKHLDNHHHDHDEHEDHDH